MVTALRRFFADPLERVTTSAFFCEKRMNARAIGLALLALAASVFTATAGEESPYEQSLKQMIRTLDRLAMTLAGIKDADTAQAARPELKKAVDEWTVIKTKAGQLPPPDQAEKDRLAKAYRSKLEEAMKKFFTEVGRVRGLPAGKDVLQEIKPVASP